MDSSIPYDYIHDYREHRWTLYIVFSCFFLLSQKKHISWSVQKKPPDGHITKLAAVVFIHITCKTLSFVTVTAVGNENNNNEKTNQTYYLFILILCIFWYVMTKLYQRQAWWTAFVWWMHPFCVNPTHSSKHRSNTRTSRVLQVHCCQTSFGHQVSNYQVSSSVFCCQNWVKTSTSASKKTSPGKKNQERILSLIGSFVLSLEMMWSFTIIKSSSGIHYWYLIRMALSSFLNLFWNKTRAWQIRTWWNGKWRLPLRAENGPRLKPFPGN